MSLNNSDKASCEAELKSLNVGHSAPKKPEMGSVEAEGVGMPPEPPEPPPQEEGMPPPPDPLEDHVVEALVADVGAGTCDGKMAPLPPGPPFATAAQFERLRVAIDSRNAEVKGTIERRYVGDRRLQHRRRRRHRRHVFNQR